MTDQQYADINILEVATVEELRAAIMNGRLVTRTNGTAVYDYDGRYYIISNKALLGEQP